tara:strand:+ start:1569 stop:2207 length:639 start_codon:yes stop_codon:yes gene_type:complete
MKYKFYIDTHKGATFFYILSLIYYYNAFDNILAMIYLSLHGSYGFFWVLKSKVFPDKTWEVKVPVYYGLVVWVGLSLYWLAPWIIISEAFYNVSSISNLNMIITLSIFLYAFGIFLHFTSDMQKFIQLKNKPGQLINDGLFKRCRNINYFGELLIYSSFALLSMHWIPAVVLFLFIILVWLPNMLKKDKSLNKYDSFEDYKKGSKLFIPFIY